MRRPATTNVAETALRDSRRSLPIVPRHRHSLRKSRAPKNSTTAGTPHTSYQTLVLSTVFTIHPNSFPMKLGTHAVAFAAAMLCSRLLAQDLEPRAYSNS